MTFVERYGCWGIVAGAAEGLGAEYAEQLAARGLNLVLVARRLELLKPLAARLTSDYRIRTKCIGLDLQMSMQPSRSSSRPWIWRWACWSTMRLPLL